jgi:hypothetical protein
MGKPSPYTPTGLPIRTLEIDPRDPSAIIQAQADQIAELKESLSTERERCIKRLLELVPMTDPDLTTDYLREELAK